jgi:hypothetical protein
MLKRMAEARAENRTRFLPYKVAREYKLFGKDKQNPKSTVLVELAFVPPNSKQYVIKQSTGSAALGERIVRKMLEGEAEAMKRSTDTDLSTANYDFQFVRQDEANGQPCYVLQQIPKRRDKQLLHGTLWIDAKTFRVQRFTGEPTKAVSWWLREAQIEFTYGLVGAMWLQIESKSSATVRIFGPYTMVSRDLEYHFDEPGGTSSIRK